MKTALLDNSVFSHAKIEKVNESVGASHNCLRRRNELAIFEIRDEYEEKHAWLNKEVRAIPTLRKSALECRVGLYFYDELFFESCRAYDRASLLDGVKFGEIQSPIERSRFFPSEPFSEYIKKESLRKFVHFLVNLSQSDVDNLLHKQNLTESDREALREIHVLRDICDGMSLKHYDDAFHYWAAERAGMDFYITFDNHFRGSLSNRKADVSCKVVSVIEFLSNVGVDALSGMPIDFGTRYDLSGRKV